MGWNDHVEQVEMECLDCEEEHTWWMWDETGKARYTGALGDFLGVDPSKGNKCPNCGSTRGEPVPDDDELLWLRRDLQWG